MSLAHLQPLLCSYLNKFALLGVQKGGACPTLPEWEALCRYNGATAE